MWIMRIVPTIAVVAIRTFYRFQRSGGDLPPEGPLLLVANHPDLASDPAILLVCARRPVRFLAKAPLFSHWFTSRFFHSAGAIPVYRRIDAPEATARNEESLGAAVRALTVDRSAVGVFPEGKSHGDPSLAQIRSGAARIALAAASCLRDGERLRIIPIGISYRDQKRFRSRAVAFVGSEVGFDDLAGEGDEEVRLLTERIEEALRAVTLNLESWEDAPVVATAEAIWSAEFARTRDPRKRIGRLQNVAASLGELRRSGDGRLEALLAEVAEFGELLRRIRLRPGELDASTRRRVALRWAGRRLPVLVAIAPLLAAGLALFAVPYAATALMTGRLSDRGAEGSVKMLGGGAIHLAWVALLSAAGAFAFGWWAGLLLLVLLPLCGVGTIVLTEQWARMRHEARRFLLLRSRRTLREQLLRRRRELAEELESLRVEVGAGGS
jgi:glycerol-3-phosphate O-acyltransferase / dihydroxyacetone phosphate acyltransferase